jgi:hypothetical protein
LGPFRGDIGDPRYQGFLLLWIGFTVAPILFGVDKFFNWMTYWPKYLWVGWPHHEEAVEAQRVGARHAA